MARHSFNEFQRELIKREIPKNQAYMFTLIYERLVDTSQQLDEMARLLTTFADGMTKVITIQQADQRSLSTLIKRVQGHTDGIEVKSVANDPE